jgi:hypothetical protein
MKLYRHKLWLQYRAEQIKLHGGSCSQCFRSSPEVVLQVHHLKYVEGRLPWDYPYAECKVLCKGCHAQEHGIIKPSRDWELIGEDDLGGLDGVCDYCGTELRYTHLIFHRNWGAMIVGAQCCDKLTESTIGSEFHLEYLNYISRRKKFIDSPKWKISIAGIKTIKRASIAIKIEPVEEGKFRIHLNNVKGKAKYESVLDAQISVFAFIESGAAKKYLTEKRAQDAKRRDSGLDNRAS